MVGFQPICRRMVRKIQGKGLKHPVELQRDEPSSVGECSLKSDETESRI